MALRAVPADKHGSESHTTLLAASGRVMAEKNAQSLPTDQCLRIPTERTRASRQLVITCNLIVIYVFLLAGCQQASHGLAGDSSCASQSGRIRWSSYSVWLRSAFFLADEIR